MLKFKNYASIPFYFSASIRYLAAILGLFLSGYLSEKFGRRKMLIVSSILQIITCSLFYFCNSFHTLNLMSALSIMVVFFALIPSYSLLSDVRLTN